MPRMGSKGRLGRKKSAGAGTARSATARRSRETTRPLLFLLLFLLFAILLQFLLQFLLLFLLQFTITLDNCSDAMRLFSIVRSGSIANGMKGYFNAYLAGKTLQILAHKPLVLQPW